jgi:hypothetical protein
MMTMFTVFRTEHIRQKQMEPMHVLACFLVCVQKHVCAAAVQELHAGNNFA